VAKPVDTAAPIETLTATPPVAGGMVAVIPTLNVKLQQKQIV
jgi:hypothetical protein